MKRRTPISTPTDPLFPYTAPCRSRPGRDLVEAALAERLVHPAAGEGRGLLAEPRRYVTRIDGEQRRVVVDLAGSAPVDRMHSHGLGEVHADMLERDREADRKSTRLNSSH